ncbi:MAG TPA: hypothetical protein VFM58_04965 [Solirubrobacteraceae bacterium]|nr:hypothetical protein [Solirubrobacteraceae bacterium]
MHGHARFVIVSGMGSRAIGRVTAALTVATVLVALAGLAIGAGPASARAVQTSQFDFVADVQGQDVWAVVPAAHGGWLVGGDAGRAGDDADYFAVARLTAAGQLDRAALRDGRALQNVAPGGNSLFGVTAMPDGGALLMGYGGFNPDDDDRDDAVIARVRADGTPDPGFGDDGVVRLRLGRRPDAFDVAVAARVLADGKILVAGDDDRGLFVARLLPDGRLDRSYGAGGVAHPLRGIRQFLVNDLFLAGRDRALIAGSALVKGSSHDGFDERNFDIAAVRVDRRGRPDRSYGRRGLVTVPAGRERVPDMDEVNAARLVRHRLILAGTIDDRTLHITRLRPDGRVDRRFGRRGHWTGPRQGAFFAAAVDARGRSWFSSSHRRRTVVHRVTAGGHTDRKLGRRGLTFDALRGGDFIRGAQVTPTGRLLIAYASAHVHILLVDP